MSFAKLNPLTWKNPAENFPSLLLATLKVITSTDAAITTG
jgi:hypothetical protein